MVMWPRVYCHNLLNVVIIDKTRWKRLHFHHHHLSTHFFYYLIRIHFRADKFSRTCSARKLEIFARIYFRAPSDFEISKTWYMAIQTKNRGYVLRKSPSPAGTQRRRENTRMVMTILISIQRTALSMVKSSNRFPNVYKKIKENPRVFLIYSKGWKLRSSLDW